MEEIDSLNQFKPEQMPSREEIDAFIKELSSVNLKNVAYDTLYHKMSVFLRPFPIFISTIRKGTSIERARFNTAPDHPWSCEKEITFRRDNESIKKYGRVNEPTQSIFYGAIDTEETQFARLTLLHEIHPEFRKDKVDTQEVVSMTIGKWLTTESLNMVDVIFHDEAIKNSARIKHAFEYHQEHSRPLIGDKWDDVMQVMKFISGEFAKRVDGSSTGYKISTAYFNFALLSMKGKVHGITYPSWIMKFQGANVAFPPGVVVNHLKLGSVAEVVVIPNGPNNYTLDMPRGAIEFGSLNSEFRWLDAHYGENGIATLTPMKRAAINGKS